MRKLIISLILLSLTGCAATQGGQGPVVNQHPALALNGAWCAVFGNALGQAVTSSLPYIGLATSGMAVLCEGEASLVNGSSATKTTLVTKTVD